jgi:mercuric ion transport protein
MRARTFSLLGAVMAAIAASACCTGPLLLAFLGVGGAGTLAAFGAHRPLILALTAVLLGSGFYLTYRHPRRAAGPGLDGSDACGCERPKASRAGRIGLWIATVLVALFAAAPTVLARSGERRGGRPEMAATAAIETAIIHVQGVDCDACAAPLRRALTKVGGLRDLVLDVPAQNALITYEPSSGRLEAYLAAIDELGYEASLVRPWGGDHSATRAQ